MKIRIDRPTDPELRRQWDEAKRAVEERGKLPLTLDDETRPVWECAQRAAAEVAAWPAWKHTEQPADETCSDRDVCDRCLGRQGIHFSWCSEQPADDDCCVGDRSQCRCAAKQLAVRDDDTDRSWIKYLALCTATDSDGDR